MIKKTDLKKLIAMKENKFLNDDDMIEIYEKLNEDDNSSRKLLKQHLELKRIYDENYVFIVKGIESYSQCRGLNGMLKSELGLKLHVRTMNWKDIISNIEANTTITNN